MWASGAVVASMLRVRRVSFTVCGCDWIILALQELSPHQHVFFFFLFVSFYPVKTTILNYQSPTTGLFPVKTCSTCKEAKVRDSLYCAASAWALSMAYRLVHKAQFTLSHIIHGDWAELNVQQIKLHRQTNLR